MPTGLKLEKKNAYMAKLISNLETKPMALIIEVDFVGSRQMQEIRMALRGKGEILMGKNTMMRTQMRKRIEELGGQEEDQQQPLVNLLENIQGNMGFCFLDSLDHLEYAREVIESNKVPAMAKQGILAPTQVTIPQGPSGLEPAQTSFFQALNINTKIVKGMIELTAQVTLFEAGEKISLSAQQLLSKMGIKPFEYGMVIRQVYQDGQCFDAQVLDITDEVLTTKFMTGVSNVAAMGRELGIPTEQGLPHMICQQFKNIISQVLDVEDFSIGEKGDEVKQILSDPEQLQKMQQAQAQASSGQQAGGDAAGGDQPQQAAQVEEEEEDDMEFDLFD